MKETTMNLAESTPVEIDAAWIAALAPAMKLRGQADAVAREARRYERAGARYADVAADKRDRERELIARYREVRDSVEAPFLAEWNRRGGWSRAYLVPDGHIHKETCCHTLHPTTLISWLPELSGQSEDEIVAAAGIHACTVCYPTAPVEALRAAEAAAKAATECPGSRKSPERWTGRRYERCPHCNQSISLTSRGLLRAHKPAAGR